MPMKQHHWNEQMSYSMASENEEGMPCFSTDQLLDRGNENLKALTNAEVDKVQFMTKMVKRRHIV